MERCPRLELRRATDGDAALLWGWANDPTVRSASFGSDPIPWDVHVAWLAERVARADCAIYIAELEGAPVAQVRFEARGGGETEVAVSVDPAARGRGVGTAAVRRACDRLFHEQPVASVLARVKVDNPASARLFEKAGFEDDGAETVRGCAARRLRLRA